MIKINNPFHNDIKNALLFDEPIEENLHIIIVTSNPCSFKKRYKLTSEFIERIQKEKNVIIYIVELIFNNQQFKFTEAHNSKHLQLTSNKVLWHKENMINLGIKYLLPNDWKAVAWIDADIEFDNHDWALNTLKILNYSRDIVQLYTNCVEMDENKELLLLHTSFGYKFTHNELKGYGSHYWHPGYAWACNRLAYEKMGGLYDRSILGSGDNIMAHSLINMGIETLKKGMNSDYIMDVFEYQRKINGLKLGYVPGIIRHYYHGSKINRKYTDREDILRKYQFNPNLHIKYNNIGLLVPTEEMTTEMLEEIYQYFLQRNEDDE
jgi:hypothetical protein